MHFFLYIVIIFLIFATAESAPTPIRRQTISAEAGSRMDPAAIAEEKMRLAREKRIADEKAARERPMQNSQGAAPIRAVNSVDTQVKQANVHPQQEDPPAKLHSDAQDSTHKGETNEVTIEPQRVSEPLHATVEEQLLSQTGETQRNTPQQHEQPQELEHLQHQRTNHDDVVLTKTAENGNSPEHVAEKMPAQETELHFEPPHHPSTIVSEARVLSDPAEAPQPGHQPAGDKSSEQQGQDFQSAEALVEQETVVGADSEQTPFAQATARELRRLLLEQASRDALEAKAQKLSKKDKKAAAADELRRLKELEKKQKSSRNELDSGSEPQASQE
jgi:hypothetical protein